MPDTLTHDQAAAARHYCPRCGLISHDARPAVRACSVCGQEGYVCCMSVPAAPIVLCRDCLAKEDA